jgi:hypothetical protein
VRKEAALTVLLADISRLFYRVNPNRGLHYFCKAPSICSAGAPGTEAGNGIRACRFWNADSRAARVIPSALHGLQPPGSLGFSPG